MGKSLKQNIWRVGGNRWLHPLSPQGTKQDRASQQSSKFERGQIWPLREAEWLCTFCKGFLAFPHGKQGDQVGNAVEFLAAVDIVMSVGRAKRWK